MQAATAQEGPVKPSAQAQTPALHTPCPEQPSRHCLSAQRGPPPPRRAPAPSPGAAGAVTVTGVVITELVRGNEKLIEKWFRFASVCLNPTVL